MRNLRTLALGLMMLVAQNLGATVGLDQLIHAKSQQPAALQQGQALFEQVCASCHGKDLSGGAGFNLKDGEWVHGDRPSDILNNVKKGFMNAGMPGFSAMFSEQELQSIVAYVLSKREGWSNLTFSLYQLNDENDTEIKADKLIKTGQLPKGLADFSIPEVQHYFIVFEGDFYAPKHLDTQIWLQWGFPHEVSMYIDGKQVEKQGTAWFPTWPVKRGKQHLKITYRSGKTKPNQRNLVLIGTNLDMTIKLYPVSTRAKGILEGKKFDLKAADKTIVQRKRILDLPPFSISVGLPAQINYAFNTKSCAIVGLWQGEMLNIGPNIGGRGEDPSLPLGKWVFKSPLMVSHNKDGGCHYLGYQFQNGEPVFSYQVNGKTYRLSAHADSNNAIHFNLSNDSGHQVELALPSTKRVQWYLNGKRNSGEIAQISSPNKNIVITAEIQD